MAHRSACAAAVAWRFESDCALFSEASASFALASDACLFYHVSRLGLRVLPDATASAIRAYLLRCGARPVCEEYFVDDVYRTAFDKDDYSTVQLEVLIN